MKQLLTLKINGESHEVWTSTHKTLLEVLREDLRLTGTKHGCELGECGACTVLIEDEPVLACLILPVEVQGQDIQTIEGLAESASSAAELKPHPLQTAFAEQGASQCGYCSPGMLMSAKALLDKNSKSNLKTAPDRHEIRAALSGNLCRCTGYSKIIDAVEQASQHESGSINKS
jgi:carbon-monoxide dehydrogenase small subunit